MFLKNITERKTNFKVSIFTEDYEETNVYIDKTIAQQVAAFVNASEEDIVKLLAEIEFIRQDSQKLRLKKGKQEDFVKENEDIFKEKLKVMLELKTVEQILDEISDMKYHEVYEYFILESEEEEEEE